MKFILSGSQVLYEVKHLGHANLNFPMAVFLFLGFIGQEKGEIMTVRTTTRSGITNQF